MKLYKRIAAIMCLAVFSMPAISFASQLELAAVVKSRQTAILSSQMDGLITDISVLAGDTFSKGDVLLSIDCTLQDAALSKALSLIHI